MFGIPDCLLYLGIMLVVILTWFLAFKRPVYEAVLLSFIVLLFVTGTYADTLSFIDAALSTSLIYSMVAFVAMSIILTKTKVIDGCINIILALLGRIPGGAGYVAVIASSFMGALSGSGPGNVMATGVITIPAMKKSGFPAELAANVESNASYMGNMIPPSSNIVAAFGALCAFDAAFDGMSTGQFWLVLWGISIWFIVQRLLTIFAFVKYYKIKPMNKEDIPSLKQSLKENWQGMLLPIFILLPFVLDFLWKDTFFTARLGAAGAKALSSGMLLFIAGVASLYAVLIVKDKKSVTPHQLAKMFAGSVKTIAPAIGVCVIGYMLGEMFQQIDIGTQIGEFVAGLHFGKFGMVIFICVLTCILGMLIPGSSIVVMLGSTFIGLLASVGVEPLLAAAMLPSICGVMCGITPPLGLGMYAGMSVANSDFSKTFKNNLFWVAGQFIMQVIVLMGWLPILGM